MGLGRVDGKRAFDEVGSGIGDKRRDGKVKWRLEGAVDVRDLIEIGLGQLFLLNALDWSSATLSPVSSMGINIHDPLVQIKGTYPSIISPSLGLISPL